MVNFGTVTSPFNVSILDAIDSEYKKAESEGRIDDNSFFDDLGDGLMNAFYDITGQEEKTSFYQAQVSREDELIKRQEEREDNAMQRAAADMMAAGLSKYGLSGGAAGSSAGGSSNVHSGSNVEFGAMLDILKAKSEIENVEANTNKTNAEAAATTAGIERDDNYYNLSVVKQAAELDRMDLLNELTKTETVQTAEQTVSIVQQRARDEAEHVYKLISMNVSNQLAYKDLNTYDDRHEAEMAVKRTSAFLNQQKAESEAKQREYINQQIKESAQNIAYKVAQEEHLSYQNQLLLEDYAYRCLQYEVGFYDLEFSKKNNLRTNDSMSRLFGINLESADENIAEKLKDGWHDLWSPIWNWSLFK